jgi:hypothetical protein
MTQNNIDLASIFQAVTQSLAENQQSLDQADTYNRDHGDNMVKTFQTITNALEKKHGASPSAALKYAAKTVSKNSASGSAQLYSQNLAQAATQFKGKGIDTQGALQLLTTLIGAGQGSGAQGGGDMLGSLLGGLMGGNTPAQQAPASIQGAQAGVGQTSQPSAGTDMLSALLTGLSGGNTRPQQPQQSGGADMLGALLTGLSGGNAQPQQSQQNSGFDLSDLLAAGMGYMQAKQQGQSGMQALVQAFVAGSGMGNTQHRNQSTAIVVQSFLSALSSMKK